MSATDGTLSTSCTVMVAVAGNDSSAVRSRRAPTGTSRRRRLWVTGTPLIVRGGEPDLRAASRHRGTGCKVEGYGVDELGQLVAVVDSHVQEAGE